MKNFTISKTFVSSSVYVNIRRERLLHTLSWLVTLSNVQGKYRGFMCRLREQQELSSPIESVEAEGERSGTDRCTWRLPQPPQSRIPWIATTSTCKLVEVTPIFALRWCFLPNCARL